MTKVDTSNVKEVVAEIKHLEKCGCEIIRVAVKSMEDAAAIRKIKRSISIPLVSDIHFDYRLALRSIESGADKIRLNPGNLRNKEEVFQVLKAAKKARIPIRIGVNSGSVGVKEKPDARNLLVGAALKYIKLFESVDFYNIVVSLKASSVRETVAAYREMAGQGDYPLHLGVTASGAYEHGVVKSAIGIGALLLDGIGDTIRVSLSAEPAEEVAAAKRILSAVGARNFGPDILSCPTCGRCQVDIRGIVKDLERKISQSGVVWGSKKPLTVAVMGCDIFYIY